MGDNQSCPPRSGDQPKGTNPQGLVPRHKGGKFLRTIGMARAEVKIGMMNLVYNMRRFTCLMQQSVAR
ncbi:hypothetical protein A4H96_04360 [Acidithiobacillus ferrooxidans]|uniref:Uncharacterized protein n=1 Tax=Acidithiobacillus ferrooxidans TaxID=920 RepID=A0A179BLD6_ACIFR|nr:hypothetical protein A4H96_04360 [Acidithiobacillus ferrooxidans]